MTIIYYWHVQISTLQLDNESEKFFILYSRIVLSSVRNSCNNICLTIAQLPMTFDCPIIASGYFMLCNFVLCDVTL